MASKPIITLKQYREMIMSKDLDKYEDLPVVVGKDDEGNGYDRVLYEPGFMELEDAVNNDWTCTIKKAVCLN